ncbi:transposase, partial [Planctomycetota bacterium]
MVDNQIKEKLRLQRKQLDPIELLHRIREGQSALATLAFTDNSVQGTGRENLGQFLAQLPQLWQAGEVRPTHQTQPTKPRYWRTRKDPFEEVWYDVLCWLQQDPDATAKILFNRLQDEYPRRFPDGQLRTLQRRIKEW